MDASASTKPNVDRTQVFNFYLSIDGIEYSAPPKLNSSVKKHTKLPDYDFDSKATWGPNSYILKPRLRRIISIDEDELLRTSRSVKTHPVTPPRTTTSSQSYTKRKFVTIAEDDENADLHPKFAKDKKQFTVKTVSKTTETEKPKPTQHRLTSKLTPNTDVRSATKFSTEINRSAKTKSASVLTTRKGDTHLRSRGQQAIPTTDSKIKHDKGTLRSSKSSKSPSKISEVNKTVPISSESDKELTKTKSMLHENLKSKPINKRPIEKSTQKLPPTPQQQQQQNKSPKVTFKDISSKSKPLTIIHVPIDKCKKKNLVEPTAPGVIERVIHIDCNDGIDNLVHRKDAVVGTDPLPTSVSTEMRDFEVNTVTLTTCETTSQTDSKNTLFDSLEIPNVTLKTDKSEPKEDLTIFETTSLPNLKVPSVNIVPQNEEMNSSDKSISQGASYILKRATLTFTTRQKFNFQLVSGETTVGQSEPSSPLHYPVNVMSVFKNGLKQKKTVKNVSSDVITKKKNTPREDYLNHLNDMKTLNCSYVYNNLMKPSDIISSIRVNNGLLQNDYICEQFQRELNFIDSFFESLQYLETCSLTEKCYSESKIENFSSNTLLFDNTFDVRNSEYDNFLSKLENGANIDDSETMASKSLCLLNLLIRDEQRRAKNLLFVLKMREDALKDFTKSQILWLEKKKKHDNTDISTLKKKQRGALLKLQHECGEMQRMRKALLALSEKRKVVLMKTKKNLELQLKNNVDVEQIILEKKKLKRNSTFDRNAAPLKCFDLSSSGCEESSTSKGTSEASPLPSAAGAPSRGTSLMSVSSAEKCVQTSDAQSAVDHGTDTAAEHFVDVDGGYLNILFHNLSLPQIFSSGKHYEVNEEALRNIVNSANSHNTNVSGSEVIEKLMDQIKNKDVERSDRSCSSPSTARSLIDEFDQFYKDLHEEDKSHANTSGVESDNSTKVCEIKDLSVQAVEDEQSEAQTSQRPGATMVAMTAESVVRVTEPSADTGEPCVCNTAVAMDAETNVDKEPVATSQTQTGPLPVPVGAAAVVDSPPPDVPAWLPSKSSPSSTGSNSVSSQSLCGSVSSIVALTAPVHVEAEELRRQQLAIEREIKALEQQQCRLLVVREIPDKPPPPYTPPTEIRTPKPPRMFSPDENLLEKVERHITCPESSSEEPAEAFCVFVRDYCQESLERFKQEQSDMPWDACNLLPQKPPVEVQEMVEKTATELKDVLTTITPAAVSGVSSRRSDHIDDILFDEWRRCEPEWTALHTDEAIVKNQIFESIFQKILNNTIEEYKKSVQREVVSPN